MTNTAPATAIAAVPLPHVLQHGAGVEAADQHDPIQVESMSLTELEERPDRRRHVGRGGSPSAARPDPGTSGAAKTAGESSKLSEHSADT